MMELADPVTALDVVANSFVEAAGSAFSSVRNVSGAGDTCCGLSSAVEAEFSTVDGCQREPCHYSVAGNALRV
jgi:hypothetical protein